MINQTTINGVQAETKLLGALDRIVNGANALHEANVRLEAAGVLRGRGADIDAPLLRHARSEVLEKLEPLLFSVGKFVGSTPTEAPQSLVTAQERVAAVMVAVKPELSDALSPLGTARTLLVTSTSDREIAKLIQSALEGPIRIFYEKQKDLRELPGGVIS